MASVWHVVSTHWLRQQLTSQGSSARNGGVRVLDVSFDKTNSTQENRELYEQGHIPEAVFYDLWRCVTLTPEIPLNLPEIDCFADYIRDMGIWKDTHLVVYDRNDPMIAYRTWWLFRVYGHNNVSVLDGGIAKWQKDGYELSTSTPGVERSEFQCRFDDTIVRDYSALVKNLQTKEYQVVDARHQDLISEEEVGTQQGYIPNSKFVDFRALFRESDGTIKSEEELLELFREAGVDMDRPVINTCLYGVRACALSAAMEMVGKPDIPVYYEVYMIFTDLRKVMFTDAEGGGEHHFSRVSKCHVHRLKRL